MSLDNSSIFVISSDRSLVFHTFPRGKSIIFFVFDVFVAVLFFLYESGTVPFNHLLSYLKADFTAFKSDWRVNLQSLRKDYSNICDQHLPFQFRPSVVVNNEGFFLATCPNHDGGCKLRMIHVAPHPVCGWQFVSST